MNFAGVPVSIECDAGLDLRLGVVPGGRAVFAIHAAAGEPYLGRTSVLQRRLRRLLTERATPSRLLNLRSLAARIEYWPVASRLESDLVLYEVARTYLPDRYLDVMKLRMPSWVRLILGTAWPRTQVTTRMTSSGMYFGPFRSRAAADAFDHDLLDLFQIRRCTEDLRPDPAHPGCIYGEMSMCLRPCQAAVTEPEYASEVVRVKEFLATGGRGALRSAEAARDRLSAEMEFEAAAQQHKRVERIQALLKSRDDLAGEADSMRGIAVLPSTAPGTVILWFLAAGCWQRPIAFDTAGDHAESMDTRLRCQLEAAAEQEFVCRERAEHLAILARWYYSSWRDGIWIGIEAGARTPFRRLVSAISKTVHQSSPPASP